jgi:hypothetical protein
MVHRRLTQLAKPRGLTAQDIDRNLLVNTEEQSARFKIDPPAGPGRNGRVVEIGKRIP